MLAERDAVLVEEAAQVVEDQVGGLRTEPVDLVEDDEGDLGVPGERPEVALVEGGVRVLLGVDDPDDGVDEAEDPVDLVAVGGDRRVVVGQVDEDESLEFGVGGAAREGRRRSRPGTASRSSSPAAPSDQLSAMGAEVVGRRSPVSETGTPARALKRVDLPLPVAPAMAITVCREESRCRAAASSSTRPASARASLSTLVRESPTSSWRASRRLRRGPP